MWSASPSPTPLCDAAPFHSVWEAGGGYREYEEISELWEVCISEVDPEIRTEALIKLGDTWLEKAFSIPLVWVFAEAAVNPEVVEQYQVNMLHMGPIRYHEFTKPVLK